MKVRPRRHYLSADVAASVDEVTCLTSYELTVPPTGEPVDLEAPDGQKAHSKVETNDDDAVVDSCIKAARAYLEDIHGICCLTQTWKMFLEHFPGEIIIRKRPVQSITSIKYIDEAGAEQTLNASVYQIDLTGHLARIKPKYGQSWPTTRGGDYKAVTVEFVAGFGVDPADVKENITAALKLHAAHLYTHREEAMIGVSVTRVPFAYDALVASDRVWSV